MPVVVPRWLAHEFLLRPDLHKLVDQLKVPRMVPPLPFYRYKLKLKWVLVESE